MGVVKDFMEILRGMTITSKHLGRRAVTVQYPEERDKIPERSRGIVVLLSDKETGEANCTSCMLCMRACPSAAIQIDAPKGDDKKRHLKEFIVDHTLCCFCGLCEEACNFTAIKMATMYEFATQEKDDLVWDMKKLLEMGKDVPYTPKPKKKKVAKPIPAAETTKAETAKAETAEADSAPASPAPAATEEKPASQSPAKPEKGDNPNG